MCVTGKCEGQVRVGRGIERVRMMREQDRKCVGDPQVE